jgi:uncharacterized protein (DUF2126 family)
VVLPPAQGWAAQREMLERTYARAAALGLGTEREAPDGSRLPPGVGERIVLGGPSPKESPFLQRPGLLRSMLRFWQRHPSLSYLFAARPVGQSSEAPRVDEGRDEALYELGIALERLPEQDADRPWLIDRVLRHLVTDASGDAARAEFRLEALYHPQRPELRLGRVVLGGWETAPGSRLAALQALLLQSILTLLWARPQTQPAPSWGPALRDRFLLPRVLEADLDGEQQHLQCAPGMPPQGHRFRG